MTISGRLVLALGRDAVPAAEVFARERSLSVHVVDDVEAIDPAEASIVFTAEARVTVSLLDRLFPPDPDLERVPGLVFASDTTALCRRAASIARQGKSDPQGNLTEIYPYRPLGDLQLGARRIVGSSAPPDALRAALTSPAEVLTISTHSNGYDLLLGDHFALCTAFDPDGDRDLTTMPSCRASGTCHRLKLPMHEVPASGRLITAEALESRILLLLTCLGMVPADSVVSPGWNYAGAVLGNPALAGMVTSWTLFVPDAETIERLVRAIYGGQSLGQAVAAHNGIAGVSRLAVLGDADAATRPLTSDALAGVRYVRPTSRPMGDGGRFLSALLYQAAMSEEGERAELAMAATEKLRLFEHVGVSGHSTSDDTEIGRECRDAVMDYFAACGNLIFDHWMPFVEAHRVTRLRCDQCGGTAERYDFTMRHSSLPDRQLLLCPRCGIRSDAAASDDRSLTIAGGRARLTGRRSARDWRAVLHLGCQDRRLSTVHPWPADADGSLAAEMALPERRPPGVLIGSLILLDDNAVSVLSAPVIPPGAGAHAAAGTFTFTRQAGRLVS